MNCVHCLPVDASYSSDNCLDGCPVNELLNGCSGDHDRSVASPSPIGPSESIADEFDTAFATVTSLGLKPCCFDCVQKVAKSAGVAVPDTISTPPSLICSMIVEKSAVDGSNRPGSTT